MSKILVFSDLHLHNWNYGSTLVDDMNSRLLDQKKVLEQIHTYLTNNHIDRVVFGGDLFHTHGKIDAAVLKVAYEGLLPIVSGWTTTFLVGNHDTATKNMSVHSLHWLNSFRKVKVVDKEYHDPLVGASFLSYTESKKTLQDFFTRANPLCFTHQGIANVPMGSGFLINEIFDVDMIPKHVDHVFSGHYHSHANPSPKATIIGSTMQLNWSDAGDKKGFLVVDANDLTFEFVEIQSPKFMTVDFANEEHTWVQIDGNFIRVQDMEGLKKDSVREVLDSLGARSVEFLPIVKEEEKLQPLKNTTFNLPELVQEYEKEKGVSQERSLIGKELMS